MAASKRDRPMRVRHPTFLFVDQTAEHPASLHSFEMPSVRGIAVMAITGKGFSQIVELLA
jgi:hypothetical protein